MNHKIVNGITLSSLVDQFHNEGYEIVWTDTTLKVFVDRDDEDPVFWGMQHSSGKNWLIGFDKELITEG